MCIVTGIATRLINYPTTQTTFKLPVQKDDRITVISPLTGNYYRILRRDIEGIIICELSMVSYQMLRIIDSWVRQLKNKDNESLWYKCPVVWCLDATTTYKKTTKSNEKHPQHLHPSKNLWHLRTLYEFTENMRQYFDNTLIDILNTFHIGKMISEHFARLSNNIL